MMNQVPTLDSVALLGTTWSGFDYPQNAEVVSLLGDGTTPGGNAVLQSSALPFRQGSLDFSLDASADVDAIRELKATRELVTFVDFEGTATSVRVFDVSASMQGNALWACTVVLLEIPVEGS